MTPSFPTRRSSDLLGIQPQFSGFRGKSAIFDGVCHQLMKDEAERDRSTRRDADIEVLKMDTVTARRNEWGQFTNGQIPQYKIGARKSVVEGKSVYVRVDIGGRSTMKKKHVEYKRRIEIT